MRDYCLEFSDYLVHQKAVSSNTLDSYIRDVGHYLLYLTQCGVENPSQANEDMIDGYVQELIKKDRSKATITRNVASIRCFYQYLIGKKELAENPARAIRPEKPQKRLPHFLSGKEIELLFSQPNIQEPKGCRDRAMLELLYATGIRVTELVELNLQDINLNTALLSCSNGKTHRTIPIYPTAIASIADYIQRVRSQQILASNEEQALFVNVKGNRLTRQGFWKIVKTYAEQAQILKEITPHMLRHSFALHLLENGAELKDIQEMMGHADIASTQVYLRLLNEHFHDAYHKCHPRAKQN